MRREEIKMNLPSSSIYPMKLAINTAAPLAKTGVADDDTDRDNAVDGLDPNPMVGDTDGDGLNDGMEKILGTDPLNPDTDRDGIADGAELRYWNVTRGLPMDVAVNYTRNPDVDRDNITDGKEINGYEVEIITGRKSVGTPIRVELNIIPDELESLIPYGYNSSDGFPLERYLPWKIA